MTPGTKSIKRFCFAIPLFLTGIGFTKPALASGDSGCYTIWRLVHHDYVGCSNMAFLSPSNDTRVNLLLMMADLRSATARPALKEATRTRPDAPLFMWEALVERLGSQDDKAMLKSASAGAQSDSAT